MRWAHKGHIVLLVLEIIGAIAWFQFVFHFRQESIRWVQFGILMYCLCLVGVTVSLSHILAQPPKDRREQ